MKANGKVSLASLVLMAAVAGGIYSVIFIVPVYLDNLDVKEAVDAAFNMSGKANDDRLRIEIKEKVNKKTVGSHKEDDGYGNIKEVGGLGITDEQIVIERDMVHNTVRIVVDYEREVELKPTKKIRVISFHVEKEGIPPS